MDNTIFEHRELGITHTIPIEQALLNLDLFWGEENVKSNYRSIKSIESLLSTDVLPTKATNDNCFELIYLVNFENNEGYALLSADDRIASDVLFVADEGMITKDELLGNNFLIEQQSDASEINLLPIDDLMRDESGNYINDVGEYCTLTTPENYPLYMESYNEYAVGDFSSQGTAFVDTLSKIRKLPFTELLFSYVFHSIEENNPEEPDFDEVDDFQQDSTNIQEEIITIEYSTYSSVRTDTVMLKNWHWHQNSPFRDKCPTVREYWIFGQKRQAYPGCVPLAVAEIMTFSSLEVYDKHLAKINLGDIRKSYTEFNEKEREDAANFVRYVGEKCGSLYFYDGTFTFPTSATIFLRWYYSNVKYQPYNNEKVMTCLRNSGPVFVCAIPTPEGLKCSHAWVVDGWKTIDTFKRKVTRANGDIINEEDTLVTTNSFVHCDFGWGGYANGYFESGIFNMTSPTVEYDSEVNDRESLYNYSKHLYAITYTK